MIGEQHRRQGRAGRLATLLTGMVLGGSLVAGYAWFDHAPHAHATNQQPAAAAPPPTAPPADFSRYRKIDLFARALAMIERHYVRPVDGERLIQAAMAGLTSELDPHSEYLRPREARLLREDIEGRFGGVGMVVVMKRVTTPKPRLVLDIREVIAGGPADKAGVVAGDFIVEVEGKPVGHFHDLSQAIMKMRGKPGTMVRFKLEPQRPGKDGQPTAQPVREVNVARAFIDAPAVVPKYLGEGLAHVRLRDFSETSARELASAIEAMRSQGKADKSGLRGVVLDLRDNGGGLLDQAVAIVDQFVGDGVIVTTRARQGQLMDVQRATARTPWRDVPLVVLVNKASASASEIVAGALQDHRRAVIVGEQSYGKGSVQAPFELGDGSILKLTIALYYTPDDRLIQASGIAPDVVVGTEYVPYRDSLPQLEPERAHPRHLKPTDFGKPAVAAGESPALQAAGEDRQLRAAVEHLQALGTVLDKPRRRGKRR